MMTAWKQVKLNDCVDLLAGYAFKSDRFSEEPNDIPLVKGENVSQGHILWDISKRWPEAEWNSLSKFQLKSGDVIIAMDRPWVPAGLKWAFIRESDPNALLVQRCSRLRPKDQRLHQRFLRFVIGSAAFESYVRPITTGVNVPHISAQQILAYEFPLPPRETQKKVAELLSAYDELIENNQRRIRILEEMARSLYREWFVHFRFPGHENHPRVSSPLGNIPKGWEVRITGDSFEVVGGGTPSRKEEAYWENGTVQWYSPTDLTRSRTMFADGSGEMITAKGLVESSARIFPKNSVMLTSRATIGVVAINTQEACTNQGFITCIPNKRLPLQYLFQWVRANVPKFQQLASGSTFKEISRGVFKTIDMIVPNYEVVRQFEDAVFPMSRQVLTLQRQVANLRTTRDLLLPRLLSGQIKLEAN